jgi:hypothetical protein
MKPILKHISLLIFSGLILPVCNSISRENTACTNNNVTSEIKAQPGDLEELGFSFYAELAFPVLKSLN